MRKLLLLTNHHPKLQVFCYIGLYYQLFPWAIKFVPKASKCKPGILFLNRARRGQMPCQIGFRSNCRMWHLGVKVSIKVLKAFLHFSEYPIDIWGQGWGTKPEGRLPIPIKKKYSWALKVIVSCFLFRYLDTWLFSYKQNLARSDIPRKTQEGKIIVELATNVLQRRASL